MANEDQVKILKQGVEVWNKWRQDNPKTIIDLVGTDLNNTDLNHVDLNNANLGNVNLINANLEQADFTEADLTLANLTLARLEGADLGYAILRETEFNEANLRNANLSGAVIVDVNLIAACLIDTSLRGVILRDVNLRYANISNAVLGDTIFAGIDLSMTNGLEDAIHILSSNVSINTIQKSKGNIPTAFLRGCGLSDLDIEYAKLANPGLDPEQVTDISYKIHQLYLGGGIQYYSCFISYSSKDQEFAQCLHDDLQNNGVRCWFDREDLKIGDPIRPTIDRQIRLRDKLLVILSENSVKSEWVGDEVEGALEEEQKGNRLVLFPIRLDDTVLNTRDDWAAKIKRRRHIGDFSNWKDKSRYQKAFERLLRDLKATSDKPASEGEIN